jgi:hypothetical protein
VVLYIKCRDGYRYRVWYRRGEALDRQEVDGIMRTWSTLIWVNRLLFLPSFVWLFIHIVCCTHPSIHHETKGSFFRKFWIKCTWAGRMIEWKFKISICKVQWRIVWWRTNFFSTFYAWIGILHPLVSKKIRQLHDLDIILCQKPGFEQVFLLSRSHWLVFARISIDLGKI